MQLFQRKIPFRVLPVLVQAQEKVSGLTARGGLVRPDMASQHLHHMAQRIVALFGAENLIDETVVHQVQRNNGEGARLCAIQNTAAATTDGPGHNRHV